MQKAEQMQLQNSSASMNAEKTDLISAARVQGESVGLTAERQHPPKPLKILLTEWLAIGLVLAFLWTLVAAGPLQNEKESIVIVTVLLLVVFLRETVIWAKEQKKAGKRTPQDRKTEI